MSAAKVVGAIRKTDTAEVRVTTNTYKGRPVADIRVWYIPTGGGDFVPSSKGVSIDSGKVSDLVDILKRLL